MKKGILLVLTVFCFAFAKVNAAPSFLQEQEFVSHTVKEGETISSIGKSYGVSEKEIYKMNPDAKSSVYEGLVLVLPSSAKYDVNSIEEKDGFKFINYKVKRKETLHGLSKQYNLPIEVIKKYNPELYSNSLRKGSKIKIPVNYAELVEAKKAVKKEKKKTKKVKVKKEKKVIKDSTETSLSAIKEHTVKAKETKYSISKKYGLTVLQLEELNPVLGDVLTEGTVLKVSASKQERQIEIEEPQFYSYEVKKGNTMYSLLKQFNIKKEDLITLNPSLANGLKTGMILKVPKEGAVLVNINEHQNRISLVDSLTDYSVKNIVVMLPFGLDRTKIDTAGVKKNMLKTDRVLRLALDFHSGVLMAVKDAERMGIAANVVVYDTKYSRKDGTATNARRVENIITANDFSEVDAVIGPLLGGNVDRVASLLAEKNIPVISPVTQRISGGPNVFQSRPSDQLLRSKMYEFLKTQSKELNVMIIADKKNNAVKSKLKTIFPNAKEVFPREGDNGLFLNSNDITSQVLTSVPNLVILETNDIPMISQVTTDLNTLASGIVGEDDSVTKYDISLFTTYKGKGYDSDAVQHEHLMNLNFHFPSMAKEFDSSNNTFVNAYKALYSITPSTQAIRGYDITMDTLLRLGYGGDMYKGVSTEIETQYVENKFNYEKTVKGYNNTATYIMKYEEDLLLKEAPVMKVMQKIEEKE